MSTSPLPPELPRIEGLQIPPPVFIEMGGEILSVDLEQGVLLARFPTQQRFQNPMGYMQGGIILAAVDNAIGPLSVMLARPSVTTQLSTSYLRPVRAEDAYITVEARLQDRTRRRLFFAATVYNPAGAITTLVQATQMIIQD